MRETAVVELVDNIVRSCGQHFAADTGSDPNAIRLSLGAAATRDDLEAGLTLINQLLQRNN